MSKQEPTAPIALWPRAPGTTLAHWLHQEIRAAILESRLAPGVRLPSRRALARRYRVSLKTVVAASEELIELGYLDARAGSGTYVRAPLPEAPPQSRELRAPLPARVPRRALSARGRLLAAQPFPELFRNRSAPTFRLDGPALDLFPIETWNHLAGQRIRRERSLEWLTHGEPLGFPPLRAASVIYSISFNRILFSSLRLGCVILPPAFVEPAAAALSVTQRYQPTTEQAIFADFIAQGHLDRHVRRMREIHAERREALLAAARAELGGLMQFSESQAGWQVTGWLAADINEAEAWRRAAATRSP